MDYKDLNPTIHLPLCNFIQDDRFRRKQVTLPRGYLKTSACTIGKALWLACKNPQIRILIASNVIENAMKMVNQIKSHVENNPRLRQFFPEIVPDSFNKIRWSDRCAEVNRPVSWPEGTWEAIGCGGSVISRHYDHIIEDDLIYAKKDDLTGGELMPNRDDIEKAIGWHKLASSLLISPGAGIIDNVGTRWAPFDLINYITKNEKGWKFFIRRIMNEEGVPSWPERFSNETIEELKASQGPYMFSTQYMCRPISSSQKVFQRDWLQPYSVLPTGMRYYTTVDLAGWDDASSGRGKHKAFNVILTCGIDHNRHLWIARIDRGRFTPTEVVEHVWQHVQAYAVEKVAFEVVYYQKAILEEVKRFYEKTGNAFLVSALNRDPKITKDARIRGLQPIAAAGALHYREDMKDFLEEYEDYPMSATRDILDALSDQPRIAHPPEFSFVAPPKNPFCLDEILEDLKKKANKNDYGIATQASNNFFTQQAASPWNMN